MTELETMLLNWLPVGTVTEEKAASPSPSTVSAEGCCSCGVLTHATADCTYGMAGGTRRGPVHPGTGSSGEPPGPVDGKRRLIRGEGLVARISDDYRPQRPVVGKDIPGRAVPCHVGTARLLETVNARTRSVACAVHHPYSDSDESDNDVLYAEEHDTTVQQVSRRKGWLTQTANNSCDEGCAKLDDFKWFLPAEERAGDLTAPESEIETWDSDSDRLDPHTDSSAVIMPSGGRSDETYGGLRLAPAIVSGRDVLMEDGAVAVDTRQVSAASDSIVSRKIQRESEYVPTIVPTVVVAPQTAAEVVQPKPRDYCYTDSLPPVSECLDSPSMDTPDSGESGMEMAGGNPPADIDVVPDVLPTAISVKTVVSDKSEIAGDDPAEESLDVGSDVCVGTDSMPTAVSVRTVVTEEWMDRFVMNPVECPSVSSTSAVARTFGPAVSEEYSPFFLLGGGAC